jgi:hypothetical protein
MGKYIKYNCFFIYAEFVSKSLHVFLSAHCERLPIGSYIDKTVKTAIVSEQVMLDFQLKPPDRAQPTILLAPLQEMHKYPKHRYVIV